MAFETCGFCDKKGLLLYPVRYAVACPAGAVDAPALSGNFKIENAPTNISAAKFTLRGVRTGYLYTYDEKRDRLKAYIVMPGGHLWNFLPELPAPSPKGKEFVCASPIEGALSMCVDVMHSDADPAQLFWMGWSNTAWTPTLVGKVKNQAWRLKHMRGIDIPKLVSGKPLNHADKFDKSHEVVSHFVMNEKAMQRAFDFSNMPISHELWRTKQASKFLKTFAQRTPINTGYVVALDDPVGIVNDLSELTVPTQHSGFDTELYRGGVIEDILQSIESAVRERAGNDFDFDMKQAQIDQENRPAEGISYTDVKNMWAVVKAGGPKELARVRNAERKKYGASVDGLRRAAQDKAWKELSTHEDKPILDETKRAALPTKYKAALEAFETQSLEIAQAHVNWLNSCQLIHWMDGVHDDTDIASGFAYRESLGQCIGKAAATKACDQLLSQWLKSADVSNINNLYARALLFNQADIVKAAEPEIRGSDLKLKYILSVYKLGLARMKKKDELRLVDKMIFTTANSIVNALGQKVNVAMRNLVVISLSLLGKTVINPSNRSAKEIADWVIESAAKKGVKLLKYSADQKQYALREVQRINPDAGLKPSICAYELDMSHLEHEGGVGPGSMKSIKIPGYDLTAKWLASSVDFNIGAVAVILQLAAFKFALQDFQRSDRFENKKYLYKLVVASMSLTGYMLELVGVALDKAPTHPLSIAIQEHWTKAGDAKMKILHFGKKIGLVAGLINSAVDFYQAYKAFVDGEEFLGSLYAGSSVVGAVLSVAACYSLAVFWPLFFTAIALAIIIAFVRKSELKKWLMHCYFSACDKIYPEIEEEFEALENALGA